MKLEWSIAFTAGIIGIVIGSVLTLIIIWDELCPLIGE
jgi:predicted cobalt transporter CbtA